MGLGDFVSGLTNAAEDGVSYVYHGVAGGENRADSRSRQDGYEQAQQQGNAARDKISESVNLNEAPSSRYY